MRDEIADYRDVGVRVSCALDVVRIMAFLDGAAVRRVVARQCPGNRRAKTP
jgi:hypothetical protein